MFASETNERNNHSQAASFELEQVSTRQEPVQTWSTIPGPQSPTSPTLNKRISNPKPVRKKKKRKLKLRQKRVGPFVPFYLREDFPEFSLITPTSTQSSIIKKKTKKYYSSLTPSRPKTNKSRGQTRPVQAHRRQGPPALSDVKVDLKGKELYSIVDYFSAKDKRDKLTEAVVTEPTRTLSSASASCRKQGKPNATNNQGNRSPADHFPTSHHVGKTSANNAERTSSEGRTNFIEEIADVVSSSNLEQSKAKSIRIVNADLDAAKAAAQMMHRERYRRVAWGNGMAGSRVLERLQQISNSVDGFKELEERISDMEYKKHKKHHKRLVALGVFADPMLSKFAESIAKDEDQNNAVANNAQLVRNWKNAQALQRQLMRQKRDDLHIKARREKAVHIQREARERYARVFRRQILAEQKHTAEQVQRRIELWSRTLVVIIAQQKFKTLHSLLPAIRDQVHSAQLLQRYVRKYQAEQSRYKHAWALAVIGKHARTWLVSRRAQRGKLAAQLIVRFLFDSKRSFCKILLRFRKCVVRAQRHVREYFACTDARIALLSKIWMQQERIYAIQVHQNKIALLSKQCKELTGGKKGHVHTTGADEVNVESSIDLHTHSRAVKRRTATVGSSATEAANHFEKAEQPSNRNGKHAAVGIEGYTAMIFPHMMSIEEATSRKETEVAVQTYMDTFLSDVLKLEIAEMRTKDPHAITPPVDKAVRYASLARVVRKWRRKHHDVVDNYRAAKYQKSIRSVAVSIDDVRAGGGSALIARMIQKSSEDERVRRTGIGIATRKREEIWPSVMLYTRVLTKDIYELVCKAHASEEVLTNRNEWDDALLPRGKTVTISI